MHWKNSFTRKKITIMRIVSINLFIPRPTHLRFFDICLLLVIILTMAIHRYIKQEKKRKRRKRPSILSSLPQLSTRNIFSFFLRAYSIALSLSLSRSCFSCFFLPYYFTKPKKRNDVRTHTLPFFCSLFLFHIGQCKVYRSFEVLEQSKGRKTSAAKHMRTT